MIARTGHYPPKYVLAQAHFIQTGKKLEHLKGGPKTNNPLRGLGYVVEKCDQIPACQNLVSD
jgi:hypothetical protein